MAVTRLERKGRTNRARANNRKAVMKHQGTKPTIKKVDIEAIKKEFEEKKKDQ
ncbi:hypothetical protein [uncultured Microscilla sp.]|uniref:hypothetical protein n=1 Tax=uncultured Microscilla sp. TaxID=432653 RepID=UPI002604F73F|nr:hypothetical protein [uncultured Microscilla sp.]